ncbi:MAG: zinc ribbon domain-containing protein [Pseudomonadota bacterium]
MQPKKITLDGPRRPCPACGQGSLAWVRRDYYLSLFFLPLFPVKTGQPYLECDHCGQGYDPARMEQAQAVAALRPNQGSADAPAGPALPEPGEIIKMPKPGSPSAQAAAPAAAPAATPAPRPEPAKAPEPAAEPVPERCRFCGGRLQPGFKYCPFCGARI